VRGAKRNSILLHIAAGIVAIFTLAPFLWMILASISPQKDLISRPLRWFPS
jgi:multiple sugar transport system permease protein